MLTTNFGIKARDDGPYVIRTTHEFVDGKRIEVQARFAKYSSMQECFEAHGSLIATKGCCYAPARAAETPEGLADALTGVYATDPKYGEKLKEIMASRGLYQTFGYDDPDGSGSREGDI